MASLGGTYFMKVAFVRQILQMVTLSLSFVDNKAEGDD